MSDSEDSMIMMEELMAEFAHLPEELRPIFDRKEKITDIVIADIPKRSPMPVPDDPLPEELTTLEFCASTSRDTYLLLKIFPAEVWLQILWKLTDPVDIENCFNSTYLFRRYLLCKRISFLFPKVYDALETLYRIPNLSAGENPIGPGPLDTFYGPLSSTNTLTAHQKLEKGVRKILKLRLVCKVWKEGIDKFYQERLMHGKPTDVAYGTVIQDNFCPKKYFYQNAECPRRFRRHFGLTHIVQSRELPLQPFPEHNPFISRSLDLQIDIYSMHNFNEFYEKMLYLCKKYGQFLNKFTFGLQVNAMLFDFFKFLGEFLAVVGNIKVLDVEVTHKIVVEEDRELNSSDPPPPFTQFSKLENLEFLAVKNAHVTFFNNFIRVNNHVKRLRLVRNPGICKYDISLVPLPNLTHLEIYFDTAEEFLKMEADTFCPPIEKLELVFYEYVGPDRLYGWLARKWGSTLAEVSFEVHGVNLKDPREIELGRKLWSEAPMWQRCYLPRVNVKVEIKF